MIRELLRKPGQTVSEMALRMRISTPTATVYLRALAARGLLRAQRDGPRVHYRVSADPTIPEAEALVRALTEELRTSRDVDRVFRLATAFTHPRRQDIYGTLRAGGCAVSELARHTRIPARSLGRHLAKLADRGFVVEASGVYRAAVPRGRLAAVLADTAPHAAR
jgi:DNA-binding transcriptional ArsR family regulator